MNKKPTVYALILVPAVCFADSSLLTFAQKNKRLYASEVNDESAFKRSVTVRRNVPSYEANVLYDDATKIITITSDLPMLPLLEVLEGCTKTGRGTGTTAGGAAASFTKQECKRVLVQPSEGGWLGATKPIPRHPVQGSIAFAGDPKQFRELKNRGFDLQVTLTPIKPNGIVVEHTEALHQARFDRRTQTMMDVYKLQARIHRVEYFYANGKVPFHVDQFE